jgi:uncharacterized YkwD family protein
MKKRIVLLVVLTMLLTTISGVLTPAENDVQAAATFERVDFISGVVTATRLNVRKGPSTDYPIIDVLKNGQWVNVLAKIGDWYAILEPNKGFVGAVSGKYLKRPEEIGKPGTPVATPTPPPATQPTPQVTVPPESPGDGDVSDEEREMLNLINKARADAGVSPLSFDAKLMEVAKLKAQDMVNNNYFSHQSPTYGSPFDMMRQFGVTFRTAGENIAGNRTVEGAYKAWMGSPGHRENIENSKFNYTGIGIVESKTYGKMFVQMFIGR